MIYGMGRGVINLTYWRRNLCGSCRGKHTLLPAHFPLPFAGKFPWRRQMFWQTKRKLWKLWIALGITMDINHFYGSHRLRSTRLGLSLSRPDCLLWPMTSLLVSTTLHCRHSKKCQKSYNELWWIAFRSQRNQK